jgi:HSP20 family molecular chaperone IbpA
LDAAKVEADYKNGVLALKLPKPAEQQARQIKIQCG